MSLERTGSLWIVLNILAVSVKGDFGTAGLGNFANPNLQNLTAQPVPTLSNDRAKYDGPFAISGAPCTTSNSLPSYEDLVFYNDLAASMYCRDGLENLTCTQCLKFKPQVLYHKVLINETAKTTAMVVVLGQKKRIALVFRGTNNLNNYAEDITYIQQHLPNNISLHAGFHLAMQSLQEQFESELAAQIKAYPKFKIQIVGHSLGGAMASLATFTLIKNDRFHGANYSLITYGQPRTGNVGYANYMNALGIPMARVTQGGDLVPHLPHVDIAKKSMLLGDYFVHHQTEYAVEAIVKGRYCSNTVYEDETCSVKMAPNYNVLDHLKYFGVDYGLCLISTASNFKTPDFLSKSHLP